MAQLRHEGLCRHVGLLALHSATPLQSVATVLAILKRLTEKLVRSVVALCLACGNGKPEGNCQQRCKKQRRMKDTQFADRTTNHDSH